MLTHEQIMKATLLRIDEDGVVIDLDKINEQACVVMTQQSVHPEYYNLLRSSALLYQAIEKQNEALEQMVALAEMVGADGIVPHLLAMQSGCNMAKRVAIEGVEKVAESLQPSNN